MNLLALLSELAAEAPDAVLLNGDVPLAGDVVNNYQVYRTETHHTALRFYVTRTVIAARR